MHVCCVRYTLNVLPLYYVYIHTQTNTAVQTLLLGVESLQCIQILQTYGADFGVKSVHGATPMNKAAASGYVGPSVCLCTFDLWILVCDRAIPGHS